MNFYVFNADSLTVDLHGEATADLLGPFETIADARHAADIQDELALHGAKSRILADATDAEHFRRADEERRTGPDSEFSYWTDVQTTSAEIVEQLIEEDTADPYDLIHEHAGSSYWAIYYHAAAKCLIYSRNKNEIFDCIELTAIDSVESFHCHAASYAYSADLRDELERAINSDGIDWSPLVRREAEYCADDCEGYDLVTKLPTGPRATFAEFADQIATTAEEQFCDRGLTLDPETLDRIREQCEQAIVPSGCILECYEGAIAEQHGEHYDHVVPAEYAEPSLETIEIRTGTLVRWTMPGCLDCGEWYEGETALDALREYLASL